MPDCIFCHVLAGKLPSQVVEGKQKYTLELDLKCEEKKKKKPGATEPVDSAAAGAPKPEGK
jgi:general secretion pathway protein L